MWSEIERIILYYTLKTICKQRRLRCEHYIISQLCACRSVVLWYVIINVVMHGQGCEYVMIDADGVLMPLHSVHVWAPGVGQVPV
jgi:hypothetical protein